MSSTDTNYIYGESNGASYREVSDDGAGSAGVEIKTHWDPRIEVQAIAGTVQVGIIPPSNKSTPDSGIWDRNDGQFLSLSRDGVNRLIEALREARTAVHGVDA
jgi:hypothetical protein